MVGHARTRTVAHAHTLTHTERKRAHHSSSSAAPSGGHCWDRLGMVGRCGGRLCADGRVVCVSVCVCGCVRVHMCACVLVHGATCWDKLGWWGAGAGA